MFDIVFDTKSNGIGYIYRTRMGGNTDKYFGPADAPTSLLTVASAADSCIAAYGPVFVAASTVVGASRHGRFLATSPNTLQGQSAVANDAVAKDLANKEIE